MIHPVGFDFNGRYFCCGGMVVLQGFFGILMCRLMVNCGEDVVKRVAKLVF